jgi:hypothetical protein
MYSYANDTTGIPMLLAVLSPSSLSLSLPPVSLFDPFPWNFFSFYLSLQDNMDAGWHIDFDGGRLAH